MGKLMYCEACERKAVGVKSKTDWVQVIFWGIITLGIYWLYYISWHIWKKEDRCPFCGIKMIDARKITLIDSKKDKSGKKHVLTLFAQPTKDEPLLNKKTLRKGEIKESWNGFYFTNIGEIILNEAKRELNSPIIKLINEREDDEWDINISSDDVEINMYFYKYKGVMSGAKNSYIQMDFDGNINTIRSIRKGILSIEGETIYNMCDWDKFTKVTGITKDEVEDAWKKDILEGPYIEDESRSIELQSSENDIPTQIKKLAELKDQGILTPDEFEQKKKELLARL